MPSAPPPSAAKASADAVTAARPDAAPTPSPAATATTPASSATTLQAAQQAEQNAPATNADALKWVEEVAQRNQLDPSWVHAQLLQARFLPQVVKLMTPAPSVTTTARDWKDYRRRFISPSRISAGVAFWRQHAETLARAQTEFGVPASIIVGIIGVETIYGKNMGNLRVLDSLATLAFDFPAAHPRAAERQRYFRGELEQFLRMMHQAGTPTTEPLGSYAGAMGLGQFMPSSWGQWAVDFDEDGHIDLFGSPADAIGSVANYLKAHGWVQGQPVWYPVRFATEQLDLPTLLQPDIRPSFTAKKMMQLGASPQGAAPHDGLLALIELKNGNAPSSYFVGTQNFYAITRYNWSSYYAAAVFDLGQEIEAVLTKRKEARVITPVITPIIMAHRH